MKKKSIILGLATAVAVATVMTGCGSDTKETAQSSEVATSTEEVASSEEISEIASSEVDTSEAEESEVDASDVEESDPASLDNKVIDPYAGIDYTIYRPSLAVDGEVSDTIMYGYVAEGENSIIYTSVGPVKVNNVSDSTDSGLSNMAGDYVELHTTGTMAMSYPGIVNATSIVKVDESVACYPEEKFTDMSAVLPEADTDENGTTLVAYIMQGWTEDSSYLVMTNSGKKVLDTAMVESNVTLQPGTFVEVTYSGNESRSLPGILMDVTAIKEMDASTTEEIAAKFNEIKNKYDEVTTDATDTEEASEEVAESAE